MNVGHNFFLGGGERERERERKHLKEYIYIYIYVCVCVCEIVYSKFENKIFLEKTVLYKNSFTCYSE